MNDRLTAVRRAAAALLALLALVPFRTVLAAAPPPNYQGLWWAAPAGSESGWGINFAHQGDVIFATWFTYDATGKALWLTMTANKDGGGNYAGGLFQTRGPAFNATPFDPNAVTARQVGSGTLTFTDASNGRFAYTVDGVAQSKAITRQAFAAMPTCVFGAQPDLALAANYQDLWWAKPAGNESGWGVNFTHQGDLVFATWFTYDTDGSPMWLSGTASRTGAGAYAGTLNRTTGPAFSAVPFLPANVSVTQVGTYTLAFTDGNNGTFAYTVNGVSQSKAITRQVFRNPGTACGYAEGVWTGTTSRGDTIRAIVTEDGRFFVLYFEGGSAIGNAVVHGNARMDGGALTTSDARDYPIAQGASSNDVVVPVALSGTYSPRSELQLSMTDDRGPRTVTAAFLEGSDRPPSTGAIAGAYTGYSGHAPGRLDVRFTIDGNGNVTGNNEACRFSGTIAPRRSLNAFDVNLAATSATGCVWGRAGNAISGILYYDAASGRVHAFLPFGLGDDLYFLTGTR